MTGHACGVPQDIALRRNGQGAPQVLCVSHFQHSAICDRLVRGPDEGASVGRSAPKRANGVGQRLPNVLHLTVRDVAGPDSGLSEMGWRFRRERLRAEPIHIGHLPVALAGSRTSGISSEDPFLYGASSVVGFVAFPRVITWPSRSSPSLPPRVLRRANSTRARRCSRTTLRE